MIASSISRLTGIGRQAAEEAFPAGLAGVGTAAVFPLPPLRERAEGEKGRAPGLLALCLAALLAACMAGAALAQVGAPIVLAPPAGSGQAAPKPSAPGPASPGASEPAAPTNETERAPGGIPGGIEVVPLHAPSTDYAGVLSPEEGGFGIDMWRGTDRALVVRLLPALPATAASPAMRDLMRRLLLSSAEAPKGAAEGPNLIALRAERLAAMGDRRGAANLLRLIPERDMDAVAARLTVDALLFADDLDAACSEIDRWIRQFSDQVYWQKAMIFCQTRAGRLDEAALGLGLLREQGETGDEAFFTLIDALSGAKDAKVKSLPAPTALHLAMLRAAGQDPPKSVLQAGDPAVLAAVATDPEADAALRLAAAERAAASGALPAEELRGLLAEQPIDPAELDNALSLAKGKLGGKPGKKPDPRSRAVLYQAAARAAQPVARATLLQAALGLARDRGDYPVAVQVYLPLLTGLEPTPELAWFALDAGRALFLAGRRDLAGRWVALARAQAGDDPEAMAAAAALGVLARIAGGGEPLQWDAASVAAWRDNQAAGGDERANQRAARLFAIFDAFDDPVGGAWQVLADGGPPAKQTAPDAALWFALGDAAAAGRLGETVLLALVSLGPDGPGSANPIILSRVLSSLRAVGLETAARALALETAVANGV